MDNKLNQLKRQLAEDCYGEQPNGKTCLECKQPFSDRNTHSEAGWKETQISGLCEDCFDALFEEEQ
jgi:hypothetical protein